MFRFNIGDMKLYKLHLLFSIQGQPVLAVPLQGTVITVAEVIKKRKIIFINSIRLHGLFIHHGLPGGISSNKYDFICCLVKPGTAEAHPVSPLLF